MKQLSRDGEQMKDQGHDRSAIPLDPTQEDLSENAGLWFTVPDELLSLAELDVRYDAGAKALWSFIRPVGRACFTPTVLRDFEVWQDLIAGNFGPGRIPLDYLILGSQTPGVFCFGGDLELFERLIEQGNRAALAHYGYRCVDILHRNMRALDLPVLTIGLVQGQALGGGFEALLSFDVIIAERGTSFGLPETMFGLFPGMGAHAILSRKLGTAMADRLITSNHSYSAETLHEMGIVAELAEPGCGMDAVRQFITKSSRRHIGLVNGRRAMRLASPIELVELRGIVDLWADAALQLSTADLRLMRRLVSAQNRLRSPV